MPNRKGGPQRKTRHLLKKNIRARGKLTMRAIFQTFKEGDKVQLVVNSAKQKGRFPLRYYGKKGEVVKKQGRAYQVKIKDINKVKSFIVDPIHLKRL